MDHPERAPLQANADFANGAVRWAICGADVAMSSELLNLRSSDSGVTWTVTDTGFGISPHHAGDRVTIHLTAEDAGTVHLVGRVASLDRVYSTANGGRDWQVTCDAELQSSPCRAR